MIESKAWIVVIVQPKMENESGLYISYCAPRYLIRTGYISFWEFYKSERSSVRRMSGHRRLKNMQPSSTNSRTNRSPPRKYQRRRAWRSLRAASCLHSALREYVLPCGTTVNQYMQRAIEETEAYQVSLPVKREYRTCHSLHVRTFRPGA